MVIVIFLPYYCAISLSITIFSLDSYSRPCGKKRLISGSIMVPVIFVCLSTYSLWCSSSLTMLISILFIIGMIPLVGRLNNSVAGLDSPGPIGVILIFNKARCLCELESGHILIVHFTSLMHALTWPLL